MSGREVNDLQKILTEHEKTVGMLVGQLHNQLPGSVPNGIFNAACDIRDAQQRLIREVEIDRLERVISDSKKDIMKATDRIKHAEVTITELRAKMEG